MQSCCLRSQVVAKMGRPKCTRKIDDGSRKIVSIVTARQITHDFQVAFLSNRVSSSCFVLKYRVILIENRKFVVYHT